MDFLMADMLSYSILPAAVIGLWRFRVIAAGYRTFVMFTWLALLNEVISSVLVYRGGSNAVNSNIYVLAEFYVLAWQFRVWAAERKVDGMMLMAGLIVTVIWVADNLVLHRLNEFNSMYRVCYSFVIVFLAVDEMNHLLLKERKNIWRNARFLICIAILVFYTYKTIFEIFFMIDLKTSDHFRNNLFIILIFVNLFANLIYALAALWIPRRLTFSLPY